MGKEIYRLKFIIFLFLVFACFQLALASDVKYDADFLQQMTSAESDGIGESLVAYSTGSLSLNNNPAGLSYTKGADFLISIHKLPSLRPIIMKETGDGEWIDYSKYDVKSNEMGALSCAIPMGKLGNLGIGFVINYRGKFIRVNQEGKAVNSFPEGDMAFVIGYGRRLFQNASFGFDIRSIRSKVPLEDGVNIGTTYALNAGFMHQIGTKVRVGAALQNIGNELSFSKLNEDIPSELRRKLLVGARYVLKDKGKSIVALNMDINPPFEDGPRYNLAMEFNYAKNIFLRLGYMRSTDEYYEELISLYDGISIHENRTWKRQGMTIGAGVRFGSMEINVAIAPSRQPIMESGEKLRLENQKNILSLSCAAKL